MADSDKDIVDPNADIDTYDESRHSPRRFPTEKLGQIADEASMMLDKVNSFFTADNTEVDGEKRSGELFNSELSRFSQEASNLKDALKLVQPEKHEAEKKQLEEQSSQDSLRKAPRRNPLRREVGVRAGAADDNAGYPSCQKSLEIPLST